MRGTPVKDMLVQAEQKRYLFVDYIRVELHKSMLFERQAQTSTDPLSLPENDILLGER